MWVARQSPLISGFDGPLRLIHHDPSPEHLIVDPQTGRQTGVLDHFSSWVDGHRMQRDIAGENALAEGGRASALWPAIIAGKPQARRANQARRW